MIRRKSMVEDLHEAKEWLASLEITFSNKRFDRYERYIGELEASRVVYRFVNHNAYDAAIEASDLILIHKGLSNYNDELLRDKLTVMLEGTDHASEEKPGKGSSNKARSTALELVIAAHFALAGFDIVFDTLPDVIAVDHNRTFYIECKRPFRLSAIKRAKEDAYRQLRRRYEAHQDSRTPLGIFALSLSKIFNPGNSTILVQNQSELQSVQEIPTSFLNRHRTLLYKKLHPSTMGVLAYFHAPLSLKNSPGTFIHRQIGTIFLSRTHNPDIAANDPERVYFQQLIRRINDGSHKAFQQ